MGNTEYSAINGNDCIKKYHIEYTSGHYGKIVPQYLQYYLVYLGTIMTHNQDAH